MRRYRLDRFPSPALIAFCLIALGCGDDRIAGTSTSVGTSIGGKVMLSNGASGAGAVVTARSDSLELRNGRLACKLIDSTRADSQGRFSLPKLPRGEFYLEIVSTHSGAAPEVFFEHYFISPLADSSLGTLMTSVSGGLQGKVESKDGSKDSSVWIGIMGTAHFARANPVDSIQAAFRLDGLYPADYFLTVVLGADSTGINFNQKLQPTKVKSGELTQVKVVF